MSSVDRQNSVYLAFVDLSKAFDKETRNHVLKKLGALSKFSIF